eukprot:13975230-Heterocapsa_arctica.AAC.1
MDRIEEVEPDSPDFSPGALAALGWDQAELQLPGLQPSEWERTLCLRLLPLLRDGYLQAKGCRMFHLLAG